MYANQLQGRLARTAAAAVGALVMLAAPAARAAVIGDGTFNDADWSLTSFTNSGSSATAGQQASGGNPGFWRKVIDFDANAGGPITNSIIIGANIYTAASYHPGAQGALGPITLSIDTLCSEASGCFGEGEGVGFLVMQGGKTYIESEFDTGNNGLGWVTHSYSGLTSSNFSLIDVTNAGLSDPTQHPDFSAGGGVIQFGFASENSALNSGYTVGSGFDNFSSNVRAFQPSTGGVPEPATWSLMLIGFGGLGLLLRRRRAVLV